MDRRVAFVARLIKEASSEAPLLDDLATAVHLSPSRLRHLFKAEMGLTPARFAKQTRLEHCRELLDTTFLTQKEIAARVGMKDARSFMRDFKARFGMTPGQYRRMRDLEGLAAGGDSPKVKVAGLGHR